MRENRFVRGNRRSHDDELERVKIFSFFLLESWVMVGERKEGIEEAQQFQVVVFPSTALSSSLSLLVLFS